MANITFHFKKHLEMGFGRRRREFTIESRKRFYI